MSRPPFRNATVAAAIALLAVACHSAGTTRTSGALASFPSVIPNTLTAEEKGAGWKLLFDGKTTSGWRGYRMKTMPPAWKVVDGVLTKNGPTEDIVTTQTFSDFELVFDWKLGPAGNSGVFYRGTEQYGRVYWSTPEFQLADDSLTPDSRNRLTAAGAVYGFYPAAKGIAKVANNWNSSRIVAKGTHVEHWMNGVKLAEYEFWSPDFTAKFKASKFRDSTQFGRSMSGFIAVQGDHNGVLSLRNIKIRPLK
jgi:hypothetical protein